MDFRLCDRDVPKVERYLGSSHTRYIYCISEQKRAMSWSSHFNTFKHYCFSEDEAI